MHSSNIYSIVNNNLIPFNNKYIFSLDNYKIFTFTIIIIIYFLLLIIYIDNNNNIFPSSQ